MKIIKLMMFLYVFYCFDAMGVTDAPILHLDFNHSEKPLEAYDIEYENNNSVKTVRGIDGSGILLINNCISVALKKNDIKNEGSISFWFKPEWGYYDNNNGFLTSHTFVSMKRDDGSYFVLSDGWWEKDGGSLFTYFVYNNKNIQHTKSKIIYKYDQWVHLTVTWSSRNGRIRVYRDGQLVSKKKIKAGEDKLTGKLFIGCDKGTNLFDKRWINSVVDDFKVYNSELNHDEVILASGLNKAELNAAKYSFLDISNKSIQNLSSHTENRIVFDSNPASWQTREQALNTIVKLKNIGVNVYIPCVWYGDGARFNSNIAPYAKYKGKGQPLKNLIEIAHKYNIEVHPWVTVVYRARKILTDFYEPGTPPNAFEIHNPKFRDFIVDFVTDLVSSYEVDGINLDYIRTMGVSKSKTAIRLFKKKYDKNLHEEVNNLDHNHSWNNYVQSFVNEPVNDIVKRISENVRKVKPNVIISVDGHPSPLFLGQSRQGRNELKWLNDGVIDIIFAMNYKSNIDYKKIDLVKKDSNKPDNIIVLLGLYDKIGDREVSRNALLVGKQIDFSRKHWGNGIALYPYSLMSNEIYMFLKNEKFKGEANVRWGR